MPENPGIEDVDQTDGRWEKMKRSICSIVLFVLCLSASLSLAAAPGYQIGIVTPPLSASEDEFRGAAKVSQKYPGMIRHIALPANFSEEQETAISQILSLGDSPDIKAIVICAGYSGI